MCWRRRLVTGLVVGALGFAGTSEKDARASITERVVAVVGERPILLSELRQRARPHLQRIASASSESSQHAAAEASVLREVLNRMVDDRLVEQAADSAHLSATAAEVENGIRRVAEETRLNPADVIAEAKRQGLSEQEYRDEIRRQIIEGKLVQLRVRGRVHVTDQDARVAYSKWLLEVAETTVDLRIIVLPIASGATAGAVVMRQALAQQIVNRTRGGEDFCKLAAQYAPAQSATPKCGSRGRVPVAALFPELAEAAKPLRPGQVAEPVLFRDPLGNQAVLVLQLAPGVHTTPYEEVAEQMRDRALAEATEGQRKQWLQELRRGVHIETRL